MAVEIRELLVRTTIESSDPKPAKKESPSSDEKEKEESAAPAQGPNSKLREQVLRDCVNMIMDNLSSFTKER